MAGNDDEHRGDLDETLDRLRDEEAGELTALQRRLRVVAAFAFIIGLGLDRFGSLVVEDHEPLSDIGLALVLAAILVLLGERGLTPLFRALIERRR